MSRKKSANEIFISRIKIKMEEKNLKQKDLAFMSNIAQGSISEYLKEDTNRSPGASELGRLAQALGVSMGWLWGLEENEGNKNKLQEENIKLASRLHMAISTLEGALKSLKSDL